MRDQEILGLHEAYNQVYEEVDTRRAPKEMIDRLNASREGHMAQDGPNKPAYDAKQRLLKKAHKKRTQVSEAHREQLFSYLLDEGFASDEKSAEAIMDAMSEAWIESIVEGGFNSSGRYDVGGGRTVGPVAGAVRSLFSGNLPKGQTYVPPSPQKGTNRPPAVPSSKNDSGKLTDFGAGGGKAKLKTGMSVGQVERQGRMNRGDYSG
jgi:hypothetical protein